MRSITQLVWPVLCFLAAGPPLGSAPPIPISIRNARVHVGDGRVIERGTVLLRGGKIEAVGAELTAPEGFYVIEGEGLEVYPGLIDALGSWGIPQPAQNRATPGGGPQPPSGASQTGAQAISRGPEDRPGSTPWIRAADLLTAWESAFDDLRSSGFTTAALAPPKSLVSGEVSVLHLAGDTVAAMTVEPRAGMFLTLERSGYLGYPRSLMGVFAYFRQLFSDARYYQLHQAAYQKNPAAVERPTYDRTLENLLATPRILLPAVRSYEIERMAQFALELGRPFILYGVQDVRGVEAMLREGNVPVIVSLRWPERQPSTDPDRPDPVRELEFRLRAPTVPAALAKAGVRFAFGSDGITSPAQLWRNLRRALAAGLPQEEALRALTLNAAEIYGLGGKLGTIEPGKSADLVVTRGSLFEEKAKVEFVVIDGRKFSPAPQRPPSEGSGLRPASPGRANSVSEGGELP